MSLMMVSMLFLQLSRALASSTRITEVLKTDVDLTDENAGQKDKKVENGRVEFKIDGYDITIMCVVEKPLHYCLAVYVDGKIKGEWISQDCEIRRKFYQKHTKSLLDSKQKKRLKREKKDFREKILKEYSYDWYEPYWKSVRSMKLHFIKNNKIIELVKAV